MAKYLYNGVLLPEVPVVENHPDYIIRRDEENGRYNVMYAKGGFYYDASASSVSALYTPVCPRYTLPLDGIGEWEYLDTAYSGLGHSSNRQVFYSNVDIKVGGSSEIWLAASEPIDPNASEEPEEVYYTISGTRLTGIADQVRRISGVTDELTPEQMETNLTNLEIPEELTSAEESIFGVNTGDTETGITTFGSENVSANNNSFALGWKFTAVEAFSIVGFRQKYNNTYSKTMVLWDVAGNEIARISTSDSATDWLSYYLDNPITVKAGETYTVSVYTYNYTYASTSNTKFNAKLRDIQFVASSGFVFPTGTAYSVYPVDIIIAPVQAELPDSYEIQRSTMDDIAEEAQRISGATTKLNTTQIINALEDVKLQEKTATPSEEVQSIVPDEGYYGLSSVTVEAVEPINLDEEIVAQDDLIAQIQAMLEGKAAGGSGSKQIFESILTDKIENNIVSVCEFVPGGILEDTTPPPESGTYYNGVKLPEIPADAMASYPYAWIRDNKTTGQYQLIMSATGFYFKDNALYDKYSAISKQYNITIGDTSATAWVDANNTTYSSWGLDANRTVLWSNHDIPNGSTTATEIYFKGSEPVIVE